MVNNPSPHWTELTEQYSISISQTSRLAGCCKLQKQKLTTTRQNNVLGLGIPRTKDIKYQNFLEICFQITYFLCSHSLLYQKTTKK